MIGDRAGTQLIRNGLLFRVWPQGGMYLVAWQVAEENIVFDRVFLRVLPE
jgi:hypothetical protein